MLYSPSTGGFYHPDRHPRIPADAAPISDSDYVALMNGQLRGMKISTGAHGRPELVAREAAPAALSVAAWKCRAVLRGMPPETTGPMARHRGDDLMAQIDTLAEWALTPAALEKFRGAIEWRSNDPMLVQLAATAGFDAARVLEWFTAAAAFDTVDLNAPGPG